MREGEAASRPEGPEPWLALAPGHPVPAGRWVRIRYRSGFRDDPIRPLLRIARRDGAVDHALLPGPVCGAAIWVGRIPPDAVDLAISPARTAEPVRFSVDSIEPLSRLRLFAGALWRRPGLALSVAVMRLRGKKVRARHLIASIWNATPMEAYAGWLAARAAPPRLEGAVIPGLAAGENREPTTGLPAIAVLIAGDDAGLVDGTRRSVAAQSEPARFVGSFGPGSSADAQSCDWILVLRAGDRLDPDALACFAAAIRRDPAATILYADEDRIDARGRRSDPILKPDWSPRLHAVRPYLGGPVLVRGVRAIPDGGDLAAALLADALAAPGAKVAHVRRILLHRGETIGPAFRSERLAVPPSPPPPTPPRKAEGSASGLASAAPLVSIVIPNRDSFALVKTCIEGLRHRTAYPAIEIVVVDNGSVAPETRDYYGSLVGDPRVTVLESPGEFNFSKLTNEGAAAARGELLLLLNNDIEVIGPDWLDRLVAEAVPDVGAVGAKLLYPDGTVQHAGVVIGMGSHAGHLYRGRADQAGWLGSLQVAHEVSAVTGACLLVAADKYRAVGGLDEERFPVSFNDIDLCLRLRERGWRNLVAPAALLYHRESATRGRDVGAKQARAEREARHFTERWLGAMRDDPYFHPGLSLARFDVDLG